MQEIAIITQLLSEEETVTDILILIDVGGSSMEYTNTGLSRAIRDTLRMTGIILFGRWDEKYKQPKFIQNGAQEDMYKRLLDMVDAGDINGAENQLWDMVEEHRFVMHSGDKEKRDELYFVGMILCVYGYMNDKDDDFLGENGFSREEIEEGIQNVLCEFGLEENIFNIIFKQV